MEQAREEALRDRDEIAEIDAILGEDVERMVIDDNVAPPPPAAPVADEHQPQAHREARGDEARGDEARGDEAPGVPIEEINNPPRPPSPVNIAFQFGVGGVEGAAPAAAVHDDGAVGGGRQNAYHQHRRVQPHPYRFGRGNRYPHRRGNRGGEQVQRRKRAREFVQWLGMMARQAYE